MTLWLDRQRVDPKNDRNMRLPINCNKTIIAIPDKLTSVPRQPFCGSLHVCNHLLITINLFLKVFFNWILS
jgi:hypothetical protein